MNIILILALFLGLNPPILTQEIKNTSDISKLKEVYQSIDNEQLYNIHNFRSVKAEPVIFEPIKRIRLSRSTYKITSFINFEPYLQSFRNYAKYLRQFRRDIETTRYVYYLNETTQKIVFIHSYSKFSLFFVKNMILFESYIL